MQGSPKFRRFGVTWNDWMATYGYLEFLGMMTWMSEKEL